MQRYILVTQGCIAASFSQVDETFIAPISSTFAGASLLEAHLPT